MAKSVASCAAVLCLLLGLLAVASAKFNVKGNVYCDTCAAGFQTRISYPIKGAKVEMECKKNGKQTYYTSGVTDGSGNFNLPTKGEHEHEFCVARAVSAPAPCNLETDSKEGPVFLNHNNGIASDDRLTGPFAFRATSTMAACNAVMAEYTLYDDDNQ